MGAKISIRPIQFYDGGWVLHIGDKRDFVIIHTHGLGHYPHFFRVLISDVNDNSRAFNVSNDMKSSVDGTWICKVDDTEIRIRTGTGSIMTNVKDDFSNPITITNGDFYTRCIAGW